MSSFKSFCETLENSVGESKVDDNLHMIRKMYDKFATAEQVLLRLAKEDTSLPVENCSSLEYESLFTLNINDKVMVGKDCGKVESVLSSGYNIKLDNGAKYYLASVKVHI